MKQLPLVKQDLDLSELWDKCIKPLNDNPLGYSQCYKNRRIHLFDAVSRGTISKMEAYDAIDAPSFPINLEVRLSAYQHLL